MWSLGCIIYELIIGNPLFPAKDENELLEYFIVTVDKIPVNMLTNAKKYKQFYTKATGFFENYGHTIKRANNSCFGSTLNESSQPISKLLNDYTDP